MLQGLAGWIYVPYQRINVTWHPERFEYSANSGIRFRENNCLFVEAEQHN